MKCQIYHKKVFELFLILTKRRGRDLLVYDEFETACENCNGTVTPNGNLESDPRFFAVLSAHARGPCSDRRKRPNMIVVTLQAPPKLG